MASSTGYITSCYCSNYTLEISQKVYLTPDEIREKLISEGVIPSAHAVRESFFALGDDFWMFIIDGRYHKFGSSVFDEGLHGGHVEPGYLEGIRKGCKFLMSNIDSNLSVDLYSQIHLNACSHFQNKKGDGTLCRGDEIMRYRKQALSCASNFESAGLEKLEQLQRSYHSIRQNWDFLLLQKVEETRTGSVDPSSQNRIHEIMKQYFPESTKQMPLEDMISGLIDPMNVIRRDLCDQIKEYEQKLNQVMSTLAMRYHLSREVVSCQTTLEGDIFIHYHQMPDERILSDLTCKLIEKFNEGLNELQSATFFQIKWDGAEKIEEIKSEYKEAVLKLIAQLYAELEWSHPWIDGQGRTDLILLNGLLTREGMHPVILQEPYFSTFHTLDEWIAYLKEGLVAYENLISIKAGK